MIAQRRRTVAPGSTISPEGPRPIAVAYAVMCGANTPSRLAREWGIAHTTTAAWYLRETQAAGLIEPGPDGFIAPDPMLVLA